MSPLYYYTCPECGLGIVDSRTIEDRDNASSCSICEVPLKRDLGFGSVAFKGSGFYSTDK